MSKENVKNQKSEKNEVKTTALQVIPVLPLVPGPSLEEKNKQLEEEIAKLKAKIEETPQTLEEKIEFFRLKQERILKLSSLEEQKKLLTVSVVKIEEKIEENDFECETFRLELRAGNHGEVVRMNNPVLIRDVVVYLVQRVDDKIEVLKAEISA